MRASQEIRWKQRIKENEERRRRYEEASKRLETEEKDNAQRALEERRAERARMDDLMRNPAQAPAPPKKPILRKGAGAVLRSPPRAVAGSRSSQRPATVPTQPSTAVSRSPSRSPVRAATACAERPRREWGEGLKQFIAGQREAAKPRLPQGMFPAVDDALSWQELKLAAEAGFEELIRMQEAAAAAAAQQPNPAWRRPGMTRATGGGGNTAEAWAGQAAQLGWPAQGFPADNPMQCSSPHTAEPPAAGNTGNSASAGSNRPLVSKWVARMQQAKPACAPEPSCSEAQSLQAGNAAAAVQACAEQGVQKQQQQQVEQQPQLQLLDAASAQQASAAVPEEQLPAGSPQELRAVTEHPGVNSTCPAGQHINSMECSGHDDKQHFTAAAAQAAAALRASMDQLHRSAQPAAADSTGSHTAVAELEAEAAVGAAAALPESVPAAASDTLQVAFQAAAQPSRQHSSADEGNSSNCERRQPRSSRATCQHSCHSSMVTPSLPEAAVMPTAAELPMGQPGALLAAASGSAALLEQAAAADGTQTGSSRDMDEQGVQVQQSARSPQAQALQVPLTCVATTAVEVPHGWSAECDQFGSPGASVCSEDPQAESLEQQHCDQQTQQADGPAAAAAAAISEQEWHEPWPRAQPSTQAEVAAASQQTGSPTPCAQVAAEDADVAACAAHAAAQHHQQQQQQEHQQQQQQPADNAGYVSASVAHSTTLDALLAEAKQLVALRRAVGAEFAAMGRSRVAAVMGAYEPDVQTLDDSGLAKAASAAVGNTQALQAVQPLAQPQMSAVQQAQEHQSVCRTSVAAPARYAAAVQAEAQWAQGNSSPATVDDTAVAAPVAAGASQPRSQPAAPASLACEDPDLVPLRQLGQQHQSQMLQQPSVWLPVDLSQQQLERQAQEQAQQPEQQRSPRASQQEPGRQLGQPALSSGGSSQLALPPLQQDTGGSAAQGRQLCFTSNPLYQPSPPSPYYDPSTQQVMVQQQQVVQQQQQQQQVRQQMMYQQAAQHGAVQQAALQQAAANQPGHLEHLGPSEEQAQYQQQVLQDQHHQQHGLMHAQQLPLPVPMPKDAVEPAISRQQFSMQQQVQQQQQQEQQQHHHRQQQQQQQEEWQQSQQQERARSLLRPRSAAGPRPCDEPCAGQSHHVAPGGAQQGYWPGPMVSQLQGRDAVPASLQHVQGAWGAAAGATGSSGLQAQHMWGVPPDAGYSHWDFQRDLAIHSEPMAVSAVLPGQYVHMQHAALGAADLAQMANVPQLHLQGAEWPANQYVAPPAAFGSDAATAAEQVPSRVTSNAASALGADTAVQCVAEGAVARGLDDPACSSSGSSGPAGSSRFLSKLASKVKSAVGRMAVGAAHHTPQQPQQQQQHQGPGQLPPKSPRQPHAQHAGEQGSYVAAALLAQQRAEAEAAERERIKAAAEAAKQAAARKAAAERAEAQRKAAEQVAQSNKLVPVAIGSYARQQNASQLQQQQQAAQGTHHVAIDTNQQLDSCGAEFQVQRTARTQAVAPVLAAAQVPAVSPAKQPAGQQPCAPQAPPSPADRNSSPRHRPVRTARRSQVQQQAQAAAGGMSGCGAAGVLARAADQYALVSRIPGAPGTKPTTPPQLSNRNTAARDAPAGVGAQSTHRMHEHQPQHQHQQQQQQQRQQQQQQQQQVPGASHCQADSDNDDFAHLERELQDDRAATAAAHAAVNKGPSYWGLHHADSVRDGYQQQQQQQMLLQQQQQLMQQQQQQMSGLPMVPGVAPIQAAWAPGMQESPRPQGMWAAVQAAAAAAAARGQQQDSAPAAGPVDHQPVQPKQQQDKRKAVPLSASSHSHSSPAKLRPLATGAVPPSTRRATMPPLPAPEAAPSSSTVKAAPVVAAATAKQLVPAKAPQPAAGRAAAKQQRQQQPSRLSLEEANLLAELQQLDQRMHHTDQHRDAPPSTCKLPDTTSVGSPSKARGATAKAAAVAAQSPVRSAPMTAPVRRGGSSAVVKLAAIRGASRGSSASNSSGCDVPPTSAHRQQQQQQKASKQAKLVSVSRTAAAAADKTRTSSPQKTAPAISAAGPAGPAFAPWGLPAGMQAQLDPRVGPQMMPHGSTGMIPGAPMGPQGYWMGTGSGMMPMGQPGAVWPEGPTAGAAGAGAGQWHQQAALQRQQGPGGAWQGMQQPMWWPGQVLPQYAAGQPYTPPMQSGLQGGYGAYSAGNGGMMMQQQQHRPGSGCMPYHMPDSCPPLTAPSGFVQPPGSPLLPTLHYQETVMRSRTSSSGSVHGYQDRAYDGSSGGGSRWGSAGSGSSGSSRGQQGDAGAGSGWASRVSHEAANVWPPRGVEKSILSGIKGARAAKGGGDGDIVVYNAHLLLS